MPHVITPASSSHIQRVQSHASVCYSISDSSISPRSYAHEIVACSSHRKLRVRSELGESRTGLKAVMA